MKVFYFVAVLSCYGIYSTAQNVQVSTPLGNIEGHFKKSYYNRTYSAFEGIPFAQPPVGDLRFREPQPATPWVGTLYANRTYSCLSYIPLPILAGPVGTEDCLYIYIYVPREVIDPDENLDVVAYIHGGGFMMGSPSMVGGPDYIMDKDLIYVSFNYRLSILGFMSTEDDVVSGNNGLKDQSMALKWINDNIKYFGGNPNSITLTGLSAGGSSVQYHYLSPLSKGLFHRGMSQSGTVLVPWALTENPLEKAKVVADTLNCDTSSTKEMVECLRKVNETELAKGTRSVFYYRNAVPFTTFGPVVEKGSSPFISDHPYQLLKSGQVYDVPWINSNTKDEGIYPVGFFVILDILQEIDERWDELMPYLLDFNSTVHEKDKAAMTKLIRKFYFHDQPVNIDTVYDLVRLFSDRLFFIDTEKSMRLHAKSTKSPVYYYYFEYILQQTFLFATGNDMERGSAHSDDSRLWVKIFGSPSKLEEEDEKMMNLFTDFVANYAKTGKPVFNNIELQPLDGQSEYIDYFDIVSTEHLKMKKMKELGPNKFWSSLPIHENEHL